MLERQAAWEESRKTARWVKKRGTLAKPFKPIKVAGPDMQAKLLTRVFKKSRPLIDLYFLWAAA